MMAKTPGDYTTNANRLVLLSLLAAIIGILAGLMSFLLLRLIGLFTHLAYFGRVGWTLVAPNPNHFGAWSNSEEEEEIHDGEDPWRLYDQC